MNFVEKLKKIACHNVFTVVAVIVICGMVMWGGCDPKVQSPIHPDKKVSRIQLNAEKDYIIAEFEVAYKDLATQELFRQQLFKLGVVFAQGGTVNPTGAIIGLLGVLGIGATADNIRKNTVIKTLKNGGK